MFVCICDFCACVCVCMFVRVCVRAQQACYYAVYVSSFIMFSSLITEMRQQFCMLFYEFRFIYKLQYSAPFVSGSLSLTFFLSGFSLLCVILRNTHIQTYILYIYVYVFIVLLLSHSCHSNTPCLFGFAYYSQRNFRSILTGSSKVNDTNS